MFGNTKLIQRTLDISRFLLAKVLRKDASKLACKGNVWGVFCQIGVWTKFWFSSFRIVFNSL